MFFQTHKIIKYHQMISGKVDNMLTFFPPSVYQTPRETKSNLEHSKNNFDFVKFQQLKYARSESTIDWLPMD